MNLTSIILTIFLACCIVSLQATAHCPQTMTYQNYSRLRAKEVVDGYIEHWQPNDYAMMPTSTPLQLMDDDGEYCSYGDGRGFSIFVTMRAGG